MKFKSKFFNFELSQFTRLVPIGEKTIALYNTLLDSLVVLQDGAADAILQHNPLLLTETEINTLIEEGHFIEDRSLELNSFWSLLYNSCNDNSVVSATVLVTTICNFACKYCFQRNAGSREHMSLDTAVKVAMDIINHSCAILADSVDITFSGGEPLLNPKAILTIIDTFGHESKKRKLPDLTFSLITNGSIRQRPILNALRSRGLNAIQLTIDGPAHIHNSRRPYSDGSSSYDDVFLMLNEPGISKVINVVVDYENSPYLSILIENISKAKYDKENLSMSFFPRVGVPGGLPHGDENDYQTFSNDIVSAYREALTNGIDVIRPGLAAPCIADRKNSVAISPSGLMYCCCNVIGNPSLEKCNIFNSGWEMTQKSYLISCNTCSLLPLCLGGCRYSNLSKGIDFSNVNCQKMLLSSLIDGYVSALVLTDSAFEKKS